MGEPFRPWPPRRTLSAPSPMDSPSKMSQASPRGLSRSGSVSSPGGRVVGVKSHVVTLERTVEEQRQLIEKLSKQLIEQRRETQAMFKEISEKWSKAFAESEEENEKKFKSIAAEIQQLHKAVTARKGETNILTQQSKDVNRQVQELAERLDDLRVEIFGEN